MQEKKPINTDNLDLEELGDLLKKSFFDVTDENLEESTQKVLDYLKKKEEKEKEEKEKEEKQ